MLALVALAVFLPHKMMLTSNDRSSSLSQKYAAPSPAQIEWQNSEIGMFVHIAPNTWNNKEGDDLTVPVSQINPTKLDTDQWAKTAVAMGAKYLIFVAKHQGGFCWWQTDTTNYSVKSIPWKNGKGDVMADIATSCRKYHLKLGIYLSPRDEYNGVDVGGQTKDPAKQQSYIATYKEQLKELLTRYGPIFEIWFDGSLKFDVSDVVNKYDPHAIQFQGPNANIRWVGNESGVAPDPCWNGAVYDPKTWGDLTSADGNPDGDRWLPNECDVSIIPTWFWNEKVGNQPKTLGHLLSIYQQSVGHGCNLLLNCPPDPSGLIPDSQVQRVAEFGKAIKELYSHPIITLNGNQNSLETMFKNSREIKSFVTCEDIKLGERVRGYDIYGKVDGQWTKLISGTSIGHKKIDTLAKPVVCEAIRWECTNSRETPHIMQFEILG